MSDTGSISRFSRVSGDYFHWGSLWLLLAGSTITTS